MKKGLHALLAIAIMLLLTVPVHAQPQSEEDLQQTDASQSSEKGWLQKAEFMEKFDKQLRTLNWLKKEKLELRIQTFDQREQLADVLLEAKKQGDLSKLKPAMELHQTMKSMHKEKHELKEQVKEQRKTFVEAMKNEDEKQMKLALKKMIDLQKQQNKLCKKQIEATDKLIKQLSK